ncbi:hypothetical protein B0I72DRAFT_135310 [Yarrowia lipolytica]|nr:hypothetical protein B0I71DRAFT_126807 [Yarrowia lipolytica]RDW34074.1 hypothetical protein B0I72DRAFT_135310 [Yarrowia lipolytica]RDW46387.1 hypothetical protein B0I74DRAFT_137141 [Yarrowia lipolytica]RDW52839.1 hypothetical protein B0I75DRAFT_137458 [Yarrowia lipolytica]
MALNGYPVSRTLYKPPKSSSPISRKQLPFLLFSLLFTPINTSPMVSFTKLAVASMATLALAAPAPEEAGLIQMRQVVEAHFGGNSEIAKRFVDDAVALDARAAQDWISLFNVFQSFTNAGVSLFLNSIQALKNVSPQQANAAITQAILQAKGALNQLIQWLQNYNGLAGWTKVLVNMFISTGLNAFITNLGLFLITLSTVISQNKLVNTFADDIKGLIATINQAGNLLADIIPGFRQDASMLVGLNSRLQGLLTN